jgi:hypothetical protein
MAASIAIVDTGPLYAAVDANDRDHVRCVEAMGTAGLRLIIPSLVVAEATYLIGSRMGPRVESAFLNSLERCEVESPLPDEWPRMAELVEKYGGFPLGGTDASVVALAERFVTDTVVTLDHRQFGAVRPLHCAYFHLLPEA